MSGDYDIDILSIETFSGKTLEGSEAIEHLDEADEVFYRVTIGSQEFYRWVGGPFEDIDSLESIISEEQEYYEELWDALR